MSDERTKYSDWVEGTERNYYWSARFNKSTDGFVGIDQQRDADMTPATSSILLSPAQVEALFRFVHPKKARR